MYNYPPFPYSIPTCDSCGKEVSLNRKGQIQPHAGLYGASRCPAERLTGEPPGLSDGERFVFAMVEAENTYKEKTSKKEALGNILGDAHALLSSQEIKDRNACIAQVFSLPGVKITIY